MKSSILLSLVALLGFSLFSNPCYASEFKKKSEKFMDDAKVTAEASKEDSQIVVAPIPISNPTIGTGLAVVGLYLHDKQEGKADIPVSTTGLMGLYTSTESWMTGVFHDGSYFNDQFRVKAGLVYADFKLKFYGVGDDSYLRDNPIDYASQNTALFTRALKELPWENWFWGGEYSIVGVDARFDITPIVPTGPDILTTTRNASLGLITQFDNRNSNTWPTDGTFFSFIASSYDEAFGGDFDYRRYKVVLNQFYPVTDPLNFSYSINGQSVNGDTPFYALSQPKLHGVTGGKYSDNNAISLQVQGKWRFKDRYNAIVFGGAGRIAEEIDDFSDSKSRYSGGIGSRYMINRMNKLALGVDFIYTDSDVNVQIVIGDIFSN